MPIYTGTADSNGDFNISLGSNSYTSGEKIIVTATKDEATKTIELHAPSEPIAPVAEGCFTITGQMWPTIVDTKLKITSQFNTTLYSYNFPNPDANALWRRIKTVEIDFGITTIQAVFTNWTSLQNILLPESLLGISQSFTFLGCKLQKLVIPASVTYIEDVQLHNGNGDSVVFNNVEDLEYYSPVVINSNKFKFVSSTWNSLAKITFGSNVSTIQSKAFNRCPNLRLIKCLGASPPGIAADSFSYGNTDTTNPVGLHTDCVVEVPASALSAYQTAPNWSAFASQMVGV